MNRKLFLFFQNKKNQFTEFYKYFKEGTGIHTGSIYNDRNTEKAGHHGDFKKFDNGATILQKTHHR